MKNKLKNISIVIISLFLICGCKRSYSGKFFSFPPESKPHENNWTYFGKIIVWDPFWKKPTEKSGRKIDINIINKKKDTVLQESLELESASIKSEIIWDNFETLTIKLYESGNEYSNDEYNKKLIKEGKNHLITLNYIWNGNSFVKNERNT